MFERFRIQRRFIAILGACAWQFVPALPVSAQPQSDGEINASTSVEIADSKFDPVALEERLQAAQNESSELRAQLAADQETARTELTASKQRNEALNEQNVSLKGTLNNLRAENSELQARVAELSAKRDKLQTTLVEAQGMLEGAQGEASELGGKLEASQNELSTLQEQLESSLSDAAAQQTSLDQAAQQNERMQRRTDEINGRLEALLAEYAETQAAFMKAKEDAARMRQKLAPDDGGAASLEAVTKAAGKANKAYAEAHAASGKAQDDPTASAAKAAAANQLDTSQFLVARITGAAGIYRVRPGDTLAVIAARTIGDSRLWQRIYDANPMRINISWIAPIAWCQVNHLSSHSSHCSLCNLPCSGLTFWVNFA